MKKKIKPSELEAEAQRLIREGKMPTFEELYRCAEIKGHILSRCVILLSEECHAAAIPALASEYFSSFDPIE